MQATADLLPAGVVLSTQNPVAGSEPFEAQGVGPCGRPDEGLQTVDLDRWVLGLHGPDGELSAVATLTASWAAHGWVVTRSPPTGGQLSQQASAVPYPDAVITLQRNDHGDVSVGVGSPCFPQSSPKAALTAPAVFSSQRS